MRRLLLVAALLLPVSLARGEDAPATAQAQEPANCADKLGVSRVIEIDPTGGAEYGAQYNDQPLQKPLLEKGEVVLTFDDGPHNKYTPDILAALAAQCTKATFFNVGEMVRDFPDLARATEAGGHTIGTHTFTHRNLGSVSLERAKHEIESTIAEEDKVLKNGVAPFFRFPYLSDPKSVREYLASRNIAVFSIDIDSFDWRVGSSEKLLGNVMGQLEKQGRGIILMHDYHAVTVKALPSVLAGLKEKGYKVVHLVPKARVEVVAVTEPVAEPAPVKRRAYRKKHRRLAKR